MNEEEKGIGEYFLIISVSFIEGLNKYGLDWYGLRALLFCYGIVGVLVLSLHMFEMVMRTQK